MIKPNRINIRYSFVAISLLLLVAIASTAWVYRLRLDEFHNYHRSFASGSSAEITSQFSFLLHERQRQITLFAEDNQSLLEQLVHDPENLAMHEEISRRLLRSFPDYFAFVLTNPRGEPYWADFDGYVGEVCVQDIRKFADAGSTPVRIHPNPIEYHYDVMAHWKSPDHQERILMISFKPDQLVQKLRTVKVPGHSLMLLLSDGSNLIEVTDQGSRTVLDREDFRLSIEEQSRIVHRTDIPDSRWQLVDMFEPGFVENYRRKLLADMAVFLLVFIGVATVSVILIRREEQGRQNAEAAREELIATVTHELRTPLTSIVGSLGLLAHGVLGTLPDKAQETVNIMNRSAEGLRRLIDDLLDSRRIETGNLRLDLHQLELAPQINEAVARNTPYAKTFNVQLEITGENEAIHVSADPDRLQQIMANLISNAVKFTPPGTRVKIHIEKPANQRVRISVSDQGPGLSDEFRAKIFQRYSQDAASTNKGVAGTGLGLNIVKTLVELHGGSIGYHSKTGQGTTFFFELPIVGRTRP